MNIIRSVIVITIVGSSALFGQATNVFPSSGNVGIGTTNPQSDLEISNDTTWPQLTISGHNGRAPFIALHQSAGTRDSPSNIGSYNGLGLITFRGYYDGAYQNAALISGGTDCCVGTGSMPGAIMFSTVPNGSASLVERMRIAPSGNVGIGTTTPQYKLAVNGQIGAKEVIVTNSGWADYVFKSGYRLQSLSEVSAYIKQNHHLPDIPSEEDVKNNGVGVGEMQAKLLAKIEELTLHMIQSDERSTRLEKQNQALQDEIHDMKTRLAQ